MQLQGLRRRQKSRRARRERKKQNLINKTIRVLAEPAKWGGILVEWNGTHWVFHERDQTLYEQDKHDSKRSLP